MSINQYNCHQKFENSSFYSPLESQKLGNNEFPWAGNSEASQTQPLPLPQLNTSIHRRIQAVFLRWRILVGFPSIPLVMVICWLFNIKIIFLILYLSCFRNCHNTSKNTSKSWLVTTETILLTSLEHREITARTQSFWLLELDFSRNINVKQMNLFPKETKSLLANYSA